MSYGRRTPGRRRVGGPRHARRVTFPSLLTLAGLVALPACRPAGPDDGPPTGPPTGEPKVSITLAWDAPETDATGAPLDDLAGFRLYFGTTSPLVTSRDTFVDVGMATSYTLRELPPGTYHFATTAIDADGNESDLSAEVTAELLP